MDTRILEFHLLVAEKNSIRTILLLRFDMELGCESEALQLCVAIHYNNHPTSSSSQTKHAKSDSQ